MSTAAQKAHAVMTLTVTYVWNRATGDTKAATIGATAFDFELETRILRYVDLEGRTCRLRGVVGFQADAHVNAADACRARTDGGPCTTFASDGPCEWCGREVR